MAGALLAQDPERARVYARLTAAPWARSRPPWAASARWAVATVAIGGGLNAGLLAAQILAVSAPALAQRLADHRRSLHDAVVAKDARLLDLGSTAYLAGMPTS